MKQVVIILLMFVVTSVTAEQVRDNAQEATGNVTVSYDNKADHLNVVAERASLRRVLNKIAQYSGIEVMFDDQAEETVNIDIQTISLEDGLKHVLKGGNYLLRYGRNEQNQLLLIGVMVLPVGENDRSGARRTVAISDEAYYRAKSQLSQEAVQKMDSASERWQLRLSEMPEKYRTQLLQKVESRLLQSATRQQIYVKNMEKERKASEQKEMKRQERREKRLQGLDAEERAAFDQGQDEAGERMRLLLLNQ